MAAPAKVCGKPGRRNGRWTFCRRTTTHPSGRCPIHRGKP